jgi:hypothetical protein
MSPFRGQLSGKRCLPVFIYLWYRDQRTRVLGKLNSRLRAWLSRGRGLVAAAGVTNRLWEISDIVGVLEDWEVHKRAPSQKVPVINFLFAARTFFQDGRMLSFCCLTRERGGYGYGQVRQR